MTAGMAPSRRSRATVSRELRARRHAGFQSPDGEGMAAVAEKIVKDNLPEPGITTSTDEVMLLHQQARDALELSDKEAR